MPSILYFRNPEGKYLPLTGGVMQGIIDMGGYDIQNIGNLKWSASTYINKNPSYEMLQFYGTYADFRTTWTRVYNSFELRGTNYIYNDKQLIFYGPNADSSNQLKSTGYIEFRNRYWNGSSSVNYPIKLIPVMINTSPSAKLQFTFNDTEKAYLDNNGALFTSGQVSSAGFASKDYDIMLTALNADYMHIMDKTTGSTYKGIAASKLYISTTGQYIDSADDHLWSSSTTKRVYYDNALDVTSIGASAGATVLSVSVARDKTSRYFAVFSLTLGTGGATSTYACYAQIRYGSTTFSNTVRTGKYYDWYMTISGVGVVERSGSGSETVSVYVYNNSGGTLYLDSGVLAVLVVPVVD